MGWLGCADRAGRVCVGPHKIVRTSEAKLVGFSDFHRRPACRMVHRVDGEGDNDQQRDQEHCAKFYYQLQANRCLTASLVTSPGRQISQIQR